MKKRSKVVGLFEYQLGRTVDRALAPGYKLKARMKAFLIREGFSQDYAEKAAGDIMEDYVNGTMDEPIWHHPAYNRD